MIKTKKKPKNKCKEESGENTNKKANNINAK